MMKSKTLFLLSIIPTAWIGVLALVYYTKFNPVWFGILRESITIPILFGAIILLVLSVIAWRKEKFAIQSYAFYAILLIVISHIVLMIS
jgi:tetrahydromethanopterin S-methyltransferase subunit E